MTPYQIELDFEHMKIDAKRKNGGESYEDEGFDEYDKESEETDNLLSDMPTFGTEASDPHKGLEELPKNVETGPGGWEDVEIDDSED